MSLEALHQAAGATLTERNGVNIPLHYGNAEAEHAASRRNIMLADCSHYAVVEVKGDDAYDFLNRVVAGDLSVIRDEQALYTLLLDEDGKIQTDLYLLCDDERFILLSEWISGNKLVSLLSALVADEDVEVVGLNDSLTSLLIEGPYAWELMSELYGYDVLGLPFLEFMKVDDGMLLRAGKHGEFSFKLLLDTSKAAEVWQRITDAGVKFDLRAGGIEFQNRSRLENPCWDPSLSGEFSNCPIELQMQWAVRYDKDEFIGRDALLSKLEAGAHERVVGFQVQGDGSSLKIGDEIQAAGKTIGKIITYGHSEAAGGYIGQAKLAAAYAYAGIEQYVAAGSNSTVAIKTCGIPFVQNFSFMVNPAEHSYVDAARPKSLLEQLQAKS